MKHGKVWGETEELIDGPMCSVHRLKIKKGSRCSMHRHAHKSNWFFVISGMLRIVVEKNDYDLTDTTELRAGEFTSVPPGEYHRFEAVTDVDALEGYFPQPLARDIDRRDHGETK